MLTAFALVTAATTITAEPASGELRHDYAATQIDCDGGGPKSADELSAVESKWRADKSLHIEFWASETGEQLIDRNWSQATLAGDTLTLAYRSYPVERQPGMPILGCSFPVRISYDLYDLDPRVYKLHLQHNSSWPRGEVGG